MLEGSVWYRRFSHPPKNDRCTLSLRLHGQPSKDLQLGHCFTSLPLSTYKLFKRFADGCRLFCLRGCLPRSGALWPLGRLPDHSSHTHPVSGFTYYQPHGTLQQMHLVSFWLGCPKLAHTLARAMCAHACLPMRITADHAES